MANLNTNIDDYNLEDLFQILGLNDKSSEDEVKEKTDEIIQKMTYENKPQLADFFEKVQKKIVDSLDEESLDDQENEATKMGDWWNNLYSNQSNKTQSNKVTERRAKIQTFDNNHFQMNRERLGINNNVQVPIAQGNMNPSLRNVTTRIVSIDSQYRQNILPFSNNDPNAPSFNTDFTLDLSEPLTNVISIKLYSVQIPTTWYTFDTTLGNTCFDFSGTTHQLPSGNYTQADLSNAIYEATNNGLILSFDNATNKSKLQQVGGTDVSFVFYKEEGFTDLSGCISCNSNSYSNQNLGWNLGFRREPSGGSIEVIIPANPGILTSDVPADLYGPKYCMLVLDDYNQNHLNKGLVNITDGDTKLSLPNYYNYDLSFNCDGTVNQVEKSGPRQLTENQLYSINEILKNRVTKKTRSYGPTTTDVLAIIPLKGVTSLRANQEPYIEFGSSVQSNTRTYFGPVNIERLRVKLIDDKGNLMNLHDNDWSFSIIVEQLYQY